MAARTTSFTTAVLLTFLVCAGVLYAGQHTGVKETASGPKPGYEVRFFCLKPRHAIGRSRLELHDNGTVAFAIENEDLVDTQGTYSLRGPAFEAREEFRIKNRDTFRYAFHFTGIKLFDAYIAGVARLKEYRVPDRLIQVIPFVFVATTKNKAEQKKKSLPFLP